MTATATDAPTLDANLASRILAWTAQTPDTTALVIPREWDESGVTAADEVTYGDLGRHVAEFWDGLGRHGIGKGDRVVVLFPVGVDLFALALATLARGATLTFVDMSMRPRHIRQALGTARPTAIVTVARVLRLAKLVPEVRSIPLKVCTDAAVSGAVALDALRGDPRARIEVTPVRPADEALVTFTTGSTGRPKGADRNHGVLAGQLDAVMAAFPGGDRNVDLSVQPVGALADLAVGATCLMAPMDYRDPASLDPAVTLALMAKWDVTRLGAAPHFLDTIEQHARESGARVASLRHLFTGGAPVSAQLCERLLDTFPGASGVVAYGATEAEPIAVSGFADIAAAHVDGYHVGCPVAGIRLVVVDLPDGIEELGPEGFDPYRVAAGAVGEIVVSGPQVISRYISGDAAARATKVVDGEGAIWHRTGDLGRLHADGSLELVGRIADVVHAGTEDVMPYPVEREIGSDPHIAWVALVCHSAAPDAEVLVVPAEGATPAAARAGAEAVLMRRGLEGIPVVAVEALALDPRHLSKLDRPEIRRTRVAAALAAAVGLERVPGALRLARLVPERQAARLLARRRHRAGARR